MALTKISTGGVKDDAASQAKIADEAVDEARLQVSNAGTNGQFLQKSSNTGGLTWATPPDNNTVYTHPNHSGEVTSTGDGATVIADNIVDEANLKVSNTPTNGQFLSAQSGNTGGLTWADVTIPPAGNTFTAVANGAIANNKAVKIDTDGKVSQIAEVVNSINTPSVAGEQAPDGNRSRHVHCCNCGTDMVLMLWFDDVTDRAEMAVGYNATASSSYFSIGPQYSSLFSYEYWFKDMAYIGNNKVVLFTRRTGTTCTAYVVSINPSTKAITVGTGVDLTGAGEFNAVSWDPDNSKLLFAWRSPNSTRGFLRHATVSGTSITLTGTQVYFPRISSANDIKNIEIVYDTNVNKHVVAFIYSSRSKYGTWFSVDSSGENPSPGTATDFLSEGIPDGWQEQFGMDFDSSTNRIVIACQKQSTSSLRLINGQCAANGTMSVNGTYTTGPSVGTNHQKGIHLVFDATVGKSFLFFINANNWSQCAFLTTSSSSNAISVSSTVNVRGSASHEIRGRSASFNNGLGSVVCMVRRQNQAYASQCVSTTRVNGTTVGSTLTGNDHYVGFADQAYTNGQTATIKTYGNHVDTLSGLTPGTKYYVQGDGTVGTSAATPTTRAGIAIGTTKLLIQEPTNWGG